MSSVLYKVLGALSKGIYVTLFLCPLNFLPCLFYVALSENLIGMLMSMRFLSF